MSGNERWKPYAFFAMHCALAVVAIMVGFVPQILFEHRFAETRLGAFAPCVVLAALLTGLFVNWHEKHRSALLVGIVGICWLLFGLWDFWSPEYRGDRPWVQETRIAFVVDNLFGRQSQCAAFECLGELFYTMPSVGMVSYAAGAAIGLWAATEKVRKLT